MSIRKPMAILLTALGALTASAGGYTLDVRFENVPDSVVFTLADRTDRELYKQKAPTAGNRLHFELDITEAAPVPMYLIGKNPADPKNDRFLIYFYAGKDINHTIVSHRPGFSTDSISFSGAPWDQARMGLDKLDSDYSNFQKRKNVEREAIYTDAEKNENGVVILSGEKAEKIKALSAELMAAQKKHFEDEAAFIVANPGSPEALRRATYRYEKIGHERLADMFSRIPDELKSLDSYEVLKQVLEVNPIVTGASMTDYDLTGEDIDGNPISLSQFTTPYILVDFNTLGCGACRAAAKKEIPKLLEDYAGVLTFVSYSADDSRKDMERCHKIDNATWPVIFNGSGNQGKDCIKYAVTSYPSFFLFGPDRKLIDKWKGWGFESLHLRLKPHIPATQQSAE